MCVSTGPGRCTLSDQQLKGPVHQTLGHQKILTQGRPGSLTSGCHTSKLGLPLAAGSTKRWGRKGLRCQASEVYMYVIIMGLHYKVRVWMLCSRFLGQRWNLDKVIFFMCFMLKTFRICLSCRPALFCCPLHLINYLFLRCSLEKTQTDWRHVGDDLSWSWRSAHAHPLPIFTRVQYRSEVHLLWLLNGKNRQ